MSDLIDRDRLLDEIFFSKAIKHKHDDDNYYAIQVAIATLESLKSAPTVDAEPVRHGRWVEYPECLKYENAYGDIDIVCSCCEAVFNVMDNDTDRFDYCPHCGAKMDERKEK